MNINMQYVTDLMIDILAIPSPGGDTYDGIERLRKEFETFGIDVKTTNKGAIIGTVAGEDDEKQVLIAAHVDTLGAIVKRDKA